VFSANAAIEGTHGIVHDDIDTSPAFHSGSDQLLDIAHDGKIGSKEDEERWN